MARKRMIHAELFEGKDFGKLSDKARSLLIACMVNADDEGRLTADPANLRAYAFRHDDMKQSEALHLTEEITSKMENVKVYEVNDCKYMQFLNWKEYQFIRADRFKSSKIPKWQPTDNQKTTKGMLKLNKVNINKTNISKGKINKDMLRTQHATDRKLEDSKSEVHRLLGYFNTKFKEYTGFNYPMSFGKDGKLMKETFNAQDKNENLILNLMDIFFEGAKQDQWHADKISIGVFKHKLPELLIQRSKEKGVLKSENRMDKV